MCSANIPADVGSVVAAAAAAAAADLATRLSLHHAQFLILTYCIESIRNHLSYLTNADRRTDNETTKQQNMRPLQKPMGVVWFKLNDLRTLDNAALTEAHQSCSSVIHFFCMDDVNMVGLHPFKSTTDPPSLIHPYAIQKWSPARLKFLRYIIEVTVTSHKLTNFLLYMFFPTP
jgi:hypothetical protein